MAQTKTSPQPDESERRTALEVENEALRARVAMLESNAAAFAAAEEKLRRSEERFRKIFTQAHDAILVIDPERDEIVDANHRACRLLGYTRSDMLALTMADLCRWPAAGAGGDSPIDGDAAVSAILTFTRQVTDSGEGSTNELMLVTRRGERLLTEISASTIQLDGRLCLLALIRDVTDHHHADQERERLLTELTRLTAVIEGTSDFIGMMDLNGQMIYVNPAGLRMVGRQNSNVAQLTMTDFLAAPAVPRFEQEILPVILEKGEVWEGELPFRHVDGRQIATLQAIMVVRHDDGTPFAVAAIVRDIREFKRAEARARELSAIVQTADVAIASISVTGIVRSWNPAAERLFGYSAGEMIGQSILRLTPPHLRHQTRAFFSQVAGGGPAVSMETIRLNKAGVEVQTAITISPVRDDIGHIVGLSSIIRDVSQRKQVEADLVKAKEAAETANRAKSAFLANMSHELRTPLNAILGFAQLLRRDRGLSQEQQDNLDIINRSGEHLLALINDILEMSKIEAGRTTVMEVGLDLHQLLADLEDMFFLRAEHKGLTLLFERDPNVPRYIFTDEGKLRQILINLISNGIKFTEHGGVTLRVGFVHDPPAAWLKVEVEDTGIGMDPVEIESLFDAFVQTRSRSTKPAGTGLGLAISREFVRMLGGDITVNSEPGHGSLFHFQIGVRLATANDISRREPARRVIGLEPGQQLYRILVVEDRPENRRILVKLLRPLGFEVKEAVNGQEAVTIWSEWSPHLILMDMRMPVLDGYEATQQIKSTTKGQATVVIAISASAFEEERAMTLSHGSDDFVRKPFREHEIFDKLAEHLGVRFIYEEDSATPTAVTDRLDPQKLHALPPTLLNNLHQATLEADFDQIFYLIEQIRMHDAPTAATLAELANNFQYDQLMALTDLSENNS